MLFRVTAKHKWLFLILLLYLALGVGYSIAVPLGETPDESEHYLYLQHVSINRALPPMSPVYEQNVTLEAHQPPLLYLAGAALTSWIELDPDDALVPNACFSFETDDPGRQNAFLHREEEWPPSRGVYLAFLVMRWFSLLLGAGTILFAYRMGRQLCAAHRKVGLLSAAALAFNPQFILITASLNNDVPAAFFGAGIIAVSVDAARRRHTRPFWLLGLLAGLGILSKLSILALWPLTWLAAFLASLTRLPVDLSAGSGGVVSLHWPVLTLRLPMNSWTLDLAQTSRKLVPLFLVPLAVAGWWYWRSYRLYGDPLMWQVSLEAKRAVIARTSPFVLSDLAEFIPFHFQSYWAWFGWLNVKPPVWVYVFVAFVITMSVVGLLRIVWDRNKAINRVALLFNGLAVLAVYASLFRYVQTINWTGYQGRLAFPVAASIALFLALGWIGLGSRRLGLIASVGLLATAVVMIPLVILPAYPRPEIYQPPHDETLTCARFEGGLQVEAIRTDQEVRPGQLLETTIFGYGLADSNGQQQMEVRLIGRAGEVVGLGTGELDWHDGAIVSATVPLTVADRALPTRGVLEIGMRTVTETWQSATSATGRILSVPVAVEAIKIAPATPVSADPQFRTEYVFADRLALIGYDLKRTNNELLVNLFWQARSEMGQDYTTFVHLVDVDGRLVGQSDSQPAAGAYPTSIWAKGEVVSDEKVLPVGENVDLNRLRLMVGVYLLETLERLPVIDSQGLSLPNSQIIILPN